MADMMETIAVYWEPVIKTYGFIEKTGLFLASCSLEPPGPDAPPCAPLPGESQAPDSELLLVTAVSEAAGRLRLQLLFTNEPDHATLARFCDPMQVRIEAPMDAVFFQGPHYGDRYGIAAAACKALHDGRVPLRSIACCGASICLIVPPGTARKACEALSQAFVTPSRQKSTTTDEP